MRINSGQETPAIHVYYSSQLNDSSFFHSLLYGMEEEGVPCHLQAAQGDTAVEIGYQAAIDSPLGVGIGIGLDEQIILHYTKLPKEQPLFQIDHKEPYKQNVLGANAARLVKGIPFKSFDEIHEQNEETLSSEEMSAIVKEVIRQVLERRQKEVEFRR
ncbi:glycerol dehydratase reactivase beta/small subunit family protein [Neobacillus sp. Marseille-QA0830]